MPIILNPNDMQQSASGEGWVEQTLADAQAFGTPAMIARRLIFEPGTRGPQRTHGDNEQLIYVIRGSGIAVVDGNELPLDHESVLWLEPGETYHFVAGDAGLEILQGYAPGDAG